MDDYTLIDDYKPKLLPIPPLTEIILGRLAKKIKVPKKKIADKKIIDTEKCWIWKGCKDKDGYGRFRIGKKSALRVPRIIYALYFHDPGDMFVLHTCDKPSCCNPNHLFLGDNSDNMIDMYSKRKAK